MNAGDRPTSDLASPSMPDGLVSGQQANGSHTARRVDDISRTAMTAWILLGLAVIAFLGLGIGLKIANENPRYPGCTGWFGIADKQCEYEIASERLGNL